jgi:hypothetical protein
MKITKYEKESIIRAIMHDVPCTPDSVLKADIQNAFVAAMSAPIQKLYKTHPKALRTDHVPSWDSGMGYRVEFIVGDADVKAVMKPFVAKKEERDSAHTKLSAIVNGCNTLAQLKKLLPEFTSYFPSEAAPTKNLPAVANMVADLSKLGWPKTKLQPTTK